MRSNTTTAKDWLTVAIGVPVTYLAAFAIGAGMLLTSLAVDLVERLAPR